jgi:hypothetical protein
MCVSEVLLSAVQATYRSVYRVSKTKGHYRPTSTKWRRSNIDHTSPCQTSSVLKESMKITWVLSIVAMNM